MHGWFGTILRVNLSTGEIAKESVDSQVVKDFVGGRGLGMHYLLKEVDPKCDPLSEENKLIFLTGALTGTKAPTAGRLMVMTKSPLTGAVTCSNTGGQFPAEVKRTGIDGFIIEGKAEAPTYIWINGDDVKLLPADDLWGKTTHAATDALLAITDPKAKVACIGPAGERLIKFATIMNEKNRCAGRSGVGAVMGAKNLKAVVVKGNQKIDLHDPEGFNAICKKLYNNFNEALKAHPNPMREFGTSMVSGVTQAHGIFPTRNFQQGVFEGWESINAATLKEKYTVGRKGCFGCPIACGRLTRVAEGPFAGEGEGPEYETIYSFGSDCGVDNMEAVIKANYLCNELGMDTMTMGATIACAMEMSEKGLIPENDIGRALKFGDSEAMVELTRMTAYREGFGDILAEGSLRLATKYGHPELAMVSKGQEFAGYDPRGLQGMGLAYATSNIGASHMRGNPAYQELFGMPVKLDPLTWDDKAPVVVKSQHFAALIDSAGLCVFYAARNLGDGTLNLHPDGLLKLLNAATGANYTVEELVQAGERIINAERLFLVKAGFSRKDDSLPLRITQEPLPDGPAKGMVCHLDEMLTHYYQVRGWTQDGAPTQEKLAELGLA